MRRTIILVCEWARRHWQAAMITLIAVSVAVGAAVLILATRS